MNRCRPLFIVLAWTLLITGSEVSVSCSSFSEVDSRALRDVASDQAAALALCADTDSGTCEPGRMRALARASYCSITATLVRHGLGDVDAGIACERK